MGIVSKTVGVYKRYGLKGFCTKLNEKISSPMRTYGNRVAEFLPMRKNSAHSGNTVSWWSLVSALWFRHMRQMNSF